MIRDRADDEWELQLGIVLITLALVGLALLLCGPQ